MEDEFSRRAGAAIRAALEPHVDRRELPGAVALVAVGADAHLEAVGTLGFDNPRAMAGDSVFRIASLTKPITAVAALSLVESGDLDLDAPVDPLLPELANRRVLRSLESELDDTVAAARPITARDLITCRLGFGSVPAFPGTFPIQVAEDRAGLKTLTAPWPPSPLGADEWLVAFGSLPLMHQPGQVWRYNTGMQVLGFLLERLSGATLEEVLRDRVLGPLGMADTTFVLRADQQERFTTAYEPDAASGELRVLDPAVGGYWSAAPASYSGAAWLLSTVDDYWRFARMVRAGGAWGGTRVLTEETVQLMCRDQLPPEVRAGTEPFLSAGTSWGLGLGTVQSGAELPLGRGYGWDGATGTMWWTDPRSDVTGILFTQRALTSADLPPVFLDFWQAVDAIAAGADT